MSSEKTESADLFDLMAWIEVNKKRLAGVCVGIVVVGFGTYVYSWASERKEQQASAALLQLQVSHESSDEAKTVSAADYLKVAGAYGGTRAAERAALLAGESLFNEKKFTEAQAQFEKFRRDFADSVLVPEAAYGVAACLDAQNKLAEAATAYQDVLARHANSPVSTQAKLALARVNEASGKPELALKVYDELANPATFNALASEANDRRDQLLAKHPELASLSTFQKPMSVTTNASGQRITLTPVATTNAATATNTATKTASPVELKVTPPAKPAK